ncbi:Cullin binding, putative [Trypanosoma equiperdum]|uniref:Defective in cullin neddylation protein n=2 Tax=Trypanozoon TaxID=39700 RepID=Q38A65_TRYB2|nr:hypothetical protein, conserved [Trypanosoma brucei brucei TREU927]EAN78305.1 hypothetical protein, conserved [Trypanosoma brucei brucei TREU927]SCU71286.1 Cullin binding, putative [Trypanosoma equiperdum]
MSWRVSCKTALLDELFTYIAGKTDANTLQKECVLALPQLETLAKMLGFSLDDMSMYRLAWSWSCEAPLCIRKSEFVNGMNAICSGVKLSATATSSTCSASPVKSPKKEFEPILLALRNHVETLDGALRGDVTKFRHFYRFIYKWVQSPLTMERNMGQVGMSIETAVELWRMLFPHYREFKRLDDWITFCMSKKLFPHGIISRDLWEQLLEFTFVTDYSKYDVSDAWPSAMDDFVEYVKSKV